MKCTYPDCSCAVSFPSGYNPSEATECPACVEEVHESLDNATEAGYVVSNMNCLELSEDLREKTGMDHSFEAIVQAVRGWKNARG